ncbi:unnamed protein product, partial [Polarella glacialis]
MMEGPVSLKLHRLSLEAPMGAVRTDDLLRGPSRGSQVRADSGHHRYARELAAKPVVRHREDIKLLRAGRDFLPMSKEPAVITREETIAPAPRLASSEQPRSLEEYIQQDLDSFWRYCPSPVDGLHRCGLLVKLFDYCGLTRKENKVTDKVKRLNSELHALGIFTTDRIEAHQRVPYEAFVQSRRLREAVQNCGDAKGAWEQKRRVGRCTEGRTPLALWVLSVISLDVQ